MSQALREQLKARLQPLLESRGFIADHPQSALFWTYRRLSGDQSHIIEVQWDKYQRPRFIINYGTCPASGLQLPDGLYPAASVAAHWTQDAGRLQDGTSAGEHWFRQDRPWWRRLLGKPAQVDAQEPVQRLMACLGEVEIYWQSGLLGPHMWPLAKPR
ncbi:hypothetical protein [Pseudomonas sp. GOM6]|uniref:hypothetical protein n=1 Tax=Pseudomonas sp. GOM6 TaxID=3036944 RepID=UPI00240933F9|nr:hypothetical protein [Pseudomonas sp. GOM6]MDG1579984.1 hypothetical protein [Pseudomonas sp. GOM6]